MEEATLEQDDLGQSPILRDQPGRARRGATVTVHGPPLASLGRQELSCRRQGLAALPRPAPASRARRPRPRTWVASDREATTSNGEDHSPPASRHASSEAQFFRAHKE